jgi:hypothetical protein
MFDIVGPLLFSHNTLMFGALLYYIPEPAHTTRGEISISDPMQSLVVVVIVVGPAPTYSKTKKNISKQQ